MVVPSSIDHNNLFHFTAGVRKKQEKVEKDKPMGYNFKVRRLPWKPPGEEGKR